jgi:predicted metalloprotease with PDZ domain
MDLTFSLGLVARNDGGVKDVQIGGPAQKAGIAPGAMITQVNGRQFSPTVLRDAIQAALEDQAPIEISVKNGEYFSTHMVNYHGGERYPHLERENSKRDVLADILKARTSKTAQ